MNMSYNVAILTVSDRSSAGLREDLSGPAIRDFLNSSKVNFQLISQKIVPDEQDRIIQMLRLWSDDYIPLILTTGGTGFSPRDITPGPQCQVDIFQWICSFKAVIQQTDY